MHKVNIPEWALDAVLAQRGSAHMFDRFDAGRTALLIIDMQNVFTAPDGMAAMPEARTIIPNINRLSSALRKKGGAVFFIKHTADRENIESFSAYYRGTIPREPECILENMGRGTRGHALHPDLQVDPEDIIVEKTRYSPFAHHSSDIHSLLQSIGIRTLIITGTATNVCCESAARDAMSLNYRIVMASDANAAKNDFLHNAALTTVYMVVGDVMSTDRIIECIDRSE